MSSKHRLSGSRIGTKLLLLNLVTWVAFLLIVGIIISSFAVVRNQITEITTRNVDNVISNSRASRQISNVFADVVTLGRNFYGKNEYLKTEGSRLTKAVEDTLRRITDPDLKKRLIEMSAQLDAFLLQCASVNSAMAAIDAIDHQTNTELTDLENLIAKLLVDLTMEGENVSFLEQLLTLVAGYRESLLLIDKTYVELGSEHYLAPPINEPSPLVTLIDDLMIRLRTITASTPEVASYGQELIQNISEYRASVLNYYKSMQALNLQIEKLNHIEASSALVLQSLDERVAGTTQLVVKRVDRTILTSAAAVIGLSILVVIALALASAYMNRALIKKPIDLILKGLDSFRKGNFDERIFLNRQDEWDIIENAFNNMAAELSVSYDELEQRISERTAELTAANESLASEIAFRQRAEKQYRDLFEQAPVMYISARTKNDLPIIVDCNTMFLDSLGVSHEEVINRPLSDFYTAESRYQMIEGGGYEETLQGRMITTERQLARKDGTVIDTMLHARPVYDEDGKINGAMASFTDISDRKRAEESLNTEKVRLAVTLQSIGDGVITTDRRGRVTLLNGIAESLTGWTQSEAIGKPLDQVFAIINEMTRQPCEDPVARVIETGKIVGLANHTVLISKDGHEYVIADSGAPILDINKKIIGVVLVFRDVTETRRMESEILKIEKLESLGVLAGGIAHDFNNFLAGIIGNISLAKLDISAAHQIYPVLDEMEKAALRAKDLTQQLLTFSKGGDPVKSIAELTSLIKESARFALRGSNVRCEFVFEDASLYAEVDESQISQVIHNLIINADQAMPAGGVVEVHGEIIELSGNNAFALEAGEYVKLAVLDQGIGIQTEQIKKVFDPYFTTKQKGSGLGLAVVYSIIDKHNGRITIDSKLGKGTTFSIYLPATRNIDPEQKYHETIITSGCGTVLVMDDEDFIRKLVGTMLEKMGYTVALARNGEEAIQQYTQALEAGQAFDVVILDLTIPGGMGGKETIAQLQLIDNGVKAIVSSGYSNDPVMSNYEQYGFKWAVKKPYMIQELSQAIAAIVSPEGCD